jgi:outer membrane protein assembly factor BamE
MNAFQPSRSRSATLLAVLLTACATLLLSGLSGCVHRIDIQQGNFLDKEDIDRVSVGMTRVQVRSLLGTPMVADPFKSSRWDYVYYLKRGRLSKPQQRHFIVFFDEADKVARIERSTEATQAAEPSTSTADRAS